MPQSASRFSGIFISYRRDDSAGHAGRLFDRLNAHFGDQVFMDIDQIEPGEDFAQVIEKAVGSCETLLALIGQNWLTSRDESGRRLDNPDDLVHLEIAAALARGARVIPVLVQGARMPRPQELPEDLSPLSRRNAVELSDLRWKHDVDQLISILDKTLAHVRGRRDAGEQPGGDAASVRPTRGPERQIRRKRRRVAFVALGALVALAVVLVSAALLLNRFGPQAAKSNADTLSHRASDLYLKGEYDEALRVVTEAIALDPKSAFAYSVRGFTYHKKGAFDLAIKDCTEALALEPKLVFAYNARALSYYDKGEYDQAIRDCTDSITLDPKASFAYAVRGNAYYSKGDYDKAVKDYTVAIALDPKSANVYESRANSYEQLNRKDLAAADRQKAAELKQGN